jgi:hypothetical protein
MQDDGDACGRRYLLGGVVEALLILPLPSYGGNPRSSLLDRAAAASLTSFSFLKALPLLLGESEVDNWSRC